MHNPKFNFNIGDSIFISEIGIGFVSSYSVRKSYGYTIVNYHCYNKKTDSHFNGKDASLCRSVLTEKYNHMISKTANELNPF